MNLIWAEVTDKETFLCNDEGYMIKPELLLKATAVRGEEAQKILMKIIKFLSFFPMNSRNKNAAFPARLSRCYTRKPVMITVGCMFNNIWTPELVFDAREIETTKVEDLIAEVFESY